MFRAAPPVAVHGNICENTLGDRDLFLAGAAPDPAFDLHGDRCCADPDNFGITGYFVADENGTMKARRGDHNGRGSAFRAPRCSGAAGEIHFATAASR